MQLFLQVFVLGVCVAAFGYVVFLNTWKRSVSERVSLGLVIVGVAFFAAWTIQRISTRATGASSQTNPPISSPQEPAPANVTKPRVGEAQAEPPAKEQAGSEPVAPTPVAEESPANTEDAEALAGSSRPVRVEVLYDGPVAAGGVVNPREVMSKELSDAGFEVLLAGTIGTPESPHERAPAGRLPPAVTAAAPTTGGTPQPGPTVSQPPSGLTVKEIFDFVRKAQQGSRVEEPKLPGSFQFLSRPLLAATPAIRAQVVVAMRASMRRLREYQGIFSTQADMEIVAVTTHGKKIQSIVTMSGPGSARGFGLDWDQAEQKALSEISSQMCPAFVKQLQQKLAENK